MFQDDLVTDSSRDPLAGSSPEEQARLDAAMRRADELLVTSLKTEERRRNRRRIFVLFIGGVVMLTIVCAMLLGWLGQQNPSKADIEKAAQLGREGWSLWQKQQFADAVPKFEEAVKLNPKNTNAWNGLGWSLFNSGDPDKAIEAFQKVLAIEPTHPAALNGLGQIFLMKRKYVDAEKFLLKAAPKATAARYGLARLYLLEGKFDDAAKWAKKVVDSGQGDDTAKEMLKAAEEKKLPDDLKAQIEPPPAD
jgi:tetratricopeptide (TPR) repeat protein